jgi:hypothetical protein
MVAEGHQKEAIRSEFNEWLRRGLSPTGEIPEKELPMR